MATSELSAITIACNNCGNLINTRARVGSAAQCTVCKKTTKIKTSDRPIHVSSAWDTETAFDGTVYLIPTDDGDNEDNCDTCNKALYWEPSRTMLYCPNCERWYMSCDVAVYYSETQTQEIDIKTTDKAEREQRINLHRRKYATYTALINNITRFDNEIDGYELGNDLDIRVDDMHGMLSGYLKEINIAKTNNELNEIIAEIDDCITIVSELIADIHAYNALSYSDNADSDDFNSDDFNSDDDVITPPNQGSSFLIERMLDRAEPRARTNPAEISSADIYQYSNEHAAMMARYVAQRDATKD